MPQKQKNRNRPEPEDRGGNQHFSEGDSEGDKPERHGPRWLMGRNDKFGVNDFFRMMRQYGGSMGGFPFGQESGGEGNTVYEDDVNYYGPPPGTPGSGTYVGDQSGISGMPGMPQMPAQTPSQTAPQAAGAPELAGQLSDDFFPPVLTGTPQAVSSSPGVLDLLTQGQGATPHVPVVSKGGAMDPVEIARLAQQAGFSGDGLRQMVATIFPESGGRPDAHNPNAGTGDNSYGLAQINMLGNLGPARLKQFGIQNNEQLFDPLTNLKAAFAVSGGGKNFSPWSAWKSGKHQQYLDDADAAIAQLASQLSGPDPATPAPTPTEPKPEEEEEDDE